MRRTAVDGQLPVRGAVHLQVSERILLSGKCILFDVRHIEY